MLVSFSNLGSFSYTSHAVFIFISGISLKHPVLLHFYLVSFSYTSHIDFVFMWGVSLTQPVLASFLSGEFLLHIPCWLHFYVESFSYTSRAGFNFISWLSLTHPALASFLCREFLAHIPCRLFLCGEFLLHIPCCLHFYARSFSYTSCAGFLMWGVSLTCSLKAGGCFMFGFSLTHPMDVLTIPTAYQNKTNKQRNKMISLSVGVSSLKKKNNK